MVSTLFRPVLRINVFDRIDQVSKSDSAFGHVVLNTQKHIRIGVRPLGVFTHYRC